MKWPSAATTASELDLNLLNAFDTVSLVRYFITSMIFGIKYAVLLWGFALTRNLETPHTKKSQRSTVGQAGRPDLFLPHVRVTEILIEQVQLRLTYLRYKLFSYPSHSIKFVSEVLWHNHSQLFWKCSSHSPRSLAMSFIQVGSFFRYIRCKAQRFLWLLWL